MIQAELLGHPSPITVILIINYKVNIQITEGPVVYLVIRRTKVCRTLVFLPMHLLYISR